MSNKLAPIVIPVIVDAAGIDRGMRTAKQKLSSGLGGQGGTDFGGVAGMGSGSRGGGGSFNSNSLKNALVTAAAIKISSKFSLPSWQPKTAAAQASANRLKTILKDDAANDRALLGEVVRHATPREMPRELANIGVRMAEKKASRIKHSILSAPRNFRQGIASTAESMGIKPWQLMAGVGIAAGTAAVAATAVVGSFREKYMAGGADGLQHLGARGSGLNDSAMNLQARFQAQPTNSGGMADRALAVAGSGPATFWDSVSTVVGSIFSAETVGFLQGELAAPITSDYSGPASRYADFWSQRYNDWNTRTYGTGDDLREARKAARKANRLAERNAI